MESVIAEKSPNPSKPAPPATKAPVAAKPTAPTVAPAQIKRAAQTPPPASVAPVRVHAAVQTPRVVPMPPAVLIDAPAVAAYDKAATAPLAGKPVSKEISPASAPRRISPPPVVIIDVSPPPPSERSEPPPAAHTAATSSASVAALPEVVSHPDPAPPAAPEQTVGLGLDPKHVLTEVLSGRHQRLVQRLHKLAFQRGHLMFNGKWMSPADAKAEYRRMLVSSWLSVLEALVVVGLILIASGVIAVLLVAIAGLGK
jgi:hypothetical protein